MNSEPTPVSQPGRSLPWPTDSQLVKRAQSSIDGHRQPRAGAPREPDFLATIDDSLTPRGGTSESAVNEESRPDLNSVDLREFAAGQMVGKFQIVRLLGKGGFGLVFLAVDTELGREVALKIPRPEGLAERDALDFLIREARAAAALHHPNIVTVFETGKFGDVVYIAAAYCDGTSLAEWLYERQSPLSAHDAAAMVADLADAVAHAHARGVIHRDLKPANILLAPVNRPRDDGHAVRPLITDFGLAKRLGQDDVKSLSDGPIGTLRYMAPEQLAGGDQAVCVQTDVYALGAILYELLTGNAPFADRQGSDWKRAVVNERPPCMSGPQRRVPRDLEAVCLKCLEKEPNQRYHTAHELQADLRQFLVGRPVVARSVGPVERFAKACRRRPVVAALLGLCVLLAAGGVWGVFSQWQRAEENLADAERQTDLARQHLQRAQEALVLLGWAVDESYFWSDSPYQFDDDFRNTLALELEPLVQANQSFPATPAVLATAHRRVAHELTECGDRASGDDHHRQSVATWRQLLRSDPTNRNYRRSTALTLYYWTQYRAQANSPRVQVDDLLTGKLIESFSLGDPVDRLIAADFAELIFRRGQALRRVEAFPSSLGTLEAAASLIEQLRDAYPSDRLFVERAAETYRAMGECYERIGKLRAAELNYVAARRCWEELVEEERSASKHQDRLAALQETIGRLRLSLGDLPGGIRSLEAAMRIYVDQARDPARTADKFRQAADAAWEAATAGYQGWSNVELLETWRRCKHLYECVGPDAASDRTVTRRLAAIARQQAAVEAAMEQRAAAGDTIRKSIAHYESLLKSGALAKEAALEYADALEQLAELQAHAADRAAAKATYQKLVGVIEALQTPERSIAALAGRLQTVRGKLAAL